MFCDRENGKWVLLLAAFLVVGFLLGAFCSQSLAQVPPVSGITALPDTVTTGPVLLEVEVASTYPWEWCGVYYQVDGSEEWSYLGACVINIYFEPPTENVTYNISTQVEDSEGNAEPYHQIKESFLFCPTCEVGPPPDCPPLTTLEHVVALSEAGFELEADSPALLYHWTQPAGGTPVEFYFAEWEVDGVVMNFPNIANDNPEYGYLEVPYTVGTVSRLRVYGCDDQNRCGPWSEWSDYWIDDGPPGVPGTPERTLIMR